jgi:hypothetical protein
MKKILRFSQNDKRKAQHDIPERFFNELLGNPGLCRGGRLAQVHELQVKVAGV